MISLALNITYEGEKLVKGREYTVRWTPDKQAAFYEVQYRLNKDMSGARTITSAAVCECTMRCWLGVKPGSRYYAFGLARVFSAWVKWRAARGLVYSRLWSGEVDMVLFGLFSVILTDFG